MVSDWIPDLGTIPQDLLTPEVQSGPPAPGRRVKQVLSEYLGTGVHHLLYLPTDWESGKLYPVIVEYAGNQWKTSAGTVEGSNLGYGISGGRGVIWVCIPFVDTERGENALTWWGNPSATVDYCVKTVKTVCTELGGDESAVFLAGFSRGSIACNSIGLRNDEIAALWRGFICHSHYDGVRLWPYVDCGSKPAAERLDRLGGRPQFISHEMEVGETRNYLRTAQPKGDFTFLSLPFPNHTDTWVLRNIPARRTVRKWFHRVLQEKPINYRAAP